MKNLILPLCLICLFAGIAHAQTTNTDTALKFNFYVTAFENHWVVLKKPDTARYYTFGYVYIESKKGFMFKPAGQFEINKRHKYILHPGKIGRYMFSPGEIDQSFAPRIIRHQDTLGIQNNRQIWPTLAAILPAKHFKELKIEVTPKWIKPYYTYSDTLEHNYRWGCYHTEEIDPAVGIDYLEKVYKVSPHYKGVKVPMDKVSWINHQGIEMKLGQAYNDTQQYGKAINLLNTAILNDPTYIPFYQELINTYFKKEDWNMVIATANRGLSTLTAVEKSDQKRDLAACIAKSYEELKNDEQGKYWRAKSLEYSLCPGCVY
ncbi:hypothetical protein [Mucilaginibacter sp. dw_454]|uniref:tetratricopeptide repeat protein n=1 Tax=Mucilaginibacter sp. dw_454 TaxID=2720079 RepID=UPI001BD2944D|nr:hypothetical protein [Mucilaginibacter sp. dw_454]